MRKCAWQSQGRHGVDPYGGPRSSVRAVSMSAPQGCCKSEGRSVSGPGGHPASPRRGCSMRRGPPLRQVGRTWLVPFPPPSRIAVDVPLAARKFVSAADDMVVITTLPKMAIIGMPAALRHSSAIGSMDTRLEPTDNIPNRGLSPFVERVRYAQHDAMDVIGHHHESIDRHRRESMRNRLPHVVGLRPGWCMDQASFLHGAEQLLPARGADRNQNSARLGIVVPGIPEAVSALADVVPQVRSP